MDIYVFKHFYIRRHRFHSCTYRCEVSHQILRAFHGFAIGDSADEATLHGFFVGVAGQFELDKADLASRKAVAGDREIDGYLEPVAILPGAREAVDRGEL